MSTRLTRPSWLRRGALRCQPDRDRHHDLEPGSDADSKRPPRRVAAWRPRP